MAPSYHFVRQMLCHVSLYNTCRPLRVLLIIGDPHPVRLGSGPIVIGLAKHGLRRGGMGPPHHHLLSSELTHALVVDDQDPRRRHHILERAPRGAREGFSTVE